MQGVKSTPTVIPVAHQQEIFEFFNDVFVLELEQTNYDSLIINQVNYFLVQAKRTRSKYPIVFELDVCSMTDFTQRLEFYLYRTKSANIKVLLKNEDEVLVQESSGQKLLFTTNLTNLIPKYFQ